MDAFFLTRVTAMLDDDYPAEQFHMDLYCNQECTKAVRQATHGMNVTVIPEARKQPWIWRKLKRGIQIYLNRVYAKIAHSSGLFERRKQ